MIPAWDYDKAPEGPYFDQLATLQEQVESADEFIAFVKVLQTDLNRDLQGWANNSTWLYLEALAAVAASLEQRFINLGEILPPQPTWKVVADMLLTARNYE